MPVLELNSPVWATLTHAYGRADDVPRMIAQLHSASPEEWKTVYDRLISAISHQGDVSTAMYAAAPYLVHLAVKLGPCPQSDDILQAIAYASRGVGPEVPDLIEEDWEDAQSDTRDLILDRLPDRQTSEQHTGALIGGVLYLSGEAAAGDLITNWCWGQQIDSMCSHCDCSVRVFWHNNRAHSRPQEQHRSGRNEQSEPLTVTPTATSAAVPDRTLEFEPEQLESQILGLSVASGHVSVQQQLRILFGTRKCASCGTHIRIQLAEDHLFENSWNSPRPGCVNLTRGTPAFAGVSSPVSAGPNCPTSADGIGCGRRYTGAHEGEAADEHSAR